MCYLEILKFWFLLCSTEFLLKNIHVTGSMLPSEMLTTDDDTVDFADFLELNDRLNKRVNEWGYTLTMHQVLTEDNYYLKLYRLSKPDSNEGSRGGNQEGSQGNRQGRGQVNSQGRGQGNSQRISGATREPKEPVLIMHGIKGCSSNYLANRNSIAYYLVDRGFDVWVGNARGTAFSLKHKEINFNHKDFWNFSFHEMGAFDIPAFLEKIKTESGKARVHYVGYSMGTTMFLVMGATRVSVVADSVASVSLISPIACPCHYKQFDNPLKRFIKKTYLTLFRLFGRGDIYTYRKTIALLYYKICTTKGIFRTLCEKWLRRKFSGMELYDHVGSVDVLPFYPCGTSVNTYLHYVQMASEGRFQEYDFGASMNTRKYLKSYPPKYNLCCIKKKIHLLVAGHDDRTNSEDLLWLQQNLKVHELVKTKLEDLDHRDFEYGEKMEALHESVQKIIQDHKQMYVLGTSKEIRTCVESC